MQPGTQEWLDQVREDVIDPDQRIVDPHHHLWPPGGGLPYGLDDLHADTGDGHRVELTVFAECGAAYRTDGPREFACVGETEFVAAQAALSAERAAAATIAGIVAAADLRRPNLDDVLDAHVEAGGPLFKGIRMSGARAIEPEALRIPGRSPEGLYQDPAFLAGVRRLGERGLTYDTWQYHHQLREFAEVAAAVPDTVMVLDHFSTPVGVGQFAGRLDEIFETWTDEIALVAAQPNVVAKIGGLAMPDNGYGWHEAERPPSSDEFVAAQARWYHRTIEVFGPERCMLESNFPVDRFSLSYRTLWNGLKKIVADYSPTERDAMFFGTAARVYSL